LTEAATRSEIQTYLKNEDILIPLLLQHSDTARARTYYDYSGPRGGVAA